MLRALANREKMLHTWKMPGNLLEMVMLTNPDDEDLINNGPNYVASELGRALFVVFIHSTYCYFDFEEINYKD